ncbi:caspase domain-containing protein [Microdochium trichocladiopsis]|uniref:Caspase domain-containing protein n=1 Tax=Microdochium trichocladiopsis TaxID=1682393 RepID=A0A9P9BJ27_9PEZI|nr:caspase domain-containing protein [Microdochium trichocladiopsis]KAH7016298.1 caspase domain-containing protein [Microdochium trichocladiopsis]
MAFPNLPKRFALLVGIDLKNENGEPHSLRELRGCVNDVRAVADRQSRQIVGPHSTTSRGNSTLAEQAGPGDLFFFHFSGHGARLQPTSKSPPGRLTDPSLMTMDFCCGNPAVRGWQLNEWLKRLNEKQIRTIVILDSCHSGGAWRTGENVRTPEGWTNVPNLPADEEAITETAVESGSRDGELEMSWSINPDGFTLMAACESHEVAAEKTVNGTSYGAFTHGLLACLKQNRPSEAIVTYRNLRDQVVKWVNGQTPRVYGRDRLAFFGDEEPFSATPLVVRLEGENIYLPIGKVHGVREKSEFTTYPPTSHITFSVDRVDDFECSARVPSALHAQTLHQHNNQIVPRRWSLGDDILQVFVHPPLGSGFQQALHAALQDRIVGDIEITEPNDSYGPDSAVFRMTQRGNDGINLAGSPSLTGYEGPVRGLDLTGVNTAQRATKSAVALAHLTRFRQILSLSGNASQQLGPFELTLKPKISGGNLSGGQGIEFVFRNTSESQLHFTVLVLSPGFHVKQLYPSEDFPKSVDPGHEVLFTFNLTVPDPLNGYEEQRDIIRTVVTRGMQLSWKSLELPDIWNADQLADKRSGSGRDANLLSECSCWVKDNPLSPCCQNAQPSQALRQLPACPLYPGSLLLGILLQEKRTRCRVMTLQLVLSGTRPSAYLVKGASDGGVRVVVHVECMEERGSKRSYPDALTSW